MMVAKYYCNKCGKEIADFNETKEYTVEWDGAFVRHSTKILLCKECATNFHRNVLHCKLMS